MPSVARFDDLAEEHPCGITANPEMVSSNVFCNNIPVHRLTDLNRTHLFLAPPICIPHQTPLVVASENFFVNNLGCSRVGDIYDCGLAIVEGSPNVFCNGN